MTGLAYNPGLQGADELVQRFVARTPLLRRVIEDLRATQPQHQLFIGQRGMGKTTLLRRVAAEVARDPTLSARWIALTFPEEQYNVGRLSDLWLNCLDALADALEQEGGTAEVGALDQFVQALPLEEAVRAPLALARLLDWTHSHRGMVLCVDNLQQLLGRLDRDERWALRKVLGEEQRLVVYAASPAAPVETTGYGEAFYDFFQAHALRALTLDETREVLQNLAAHAGKQEVAASFAEKGGRLRALHVLTGGNPRSVVQLFQVVSAMPGAEIRAQLEGLLDQCTPLYKARFEELAEQAQLVLDALAHHWDPATAAMVAERTRIDVNTVSTQLHRLHNEGLVDKVDIPDEARQGFQVAERFFNLWYLMRASRRHRGRVLSLARCLETLYDIDDLQALGAQLLATPNDADLSLALARALPDGGLRRALWSSAIDQVGGDEKGLRELLVQLGAGGEPVRELAERKRRAKEAMRIAKEINFEEMGIEREMGELVFVAVGSVGGNLDSLMADPRFAPALREFALSFGRDHVVLGPAVWRCVRDSVCAGVLSSPALDEQDASDLEAAALRHGCWQLRLKLALDAFVRVDAQLHELSADPTRVLGRIVAQARSPGDLPTVPPAGAMREGWEQLYRSLLHHPAAEGNPEIAALLTESVRCAFSSGSVDPWTLFGFLYAGPSESELDLAVTRLRGSADPATAWWGQRFLPVLAPQLPLPALQLWHHFAKTSDPLEHTESLLAFLAGLIRAGHSPDALEIASGLRDRAAPLHAAMVAVEGRDVALLGRFAPEIAIPARDMLQVLWPQGLTQPPKPRGRKNRPGRG